MGIGSSVVQNHFLGCDFHVCTMLHRREASTFVFSSSTLGEKKNSHMGRGPTKNLHFFFEKLFFLKIWPSKSGYRQLRRPKSLPRMRFSSLYDASPPRNITVCVFDLDLGRKKTSLRKGAPDLSKKKQKCKLISYQYYKIFVLKSQQKPSGK